MFMRESQPRVAVALSAAFGADAARDATAEAFAYAWEHWDRVGGMTNPAGYVYRVGHHRASKQRRTPAVVVPEPSNHDPWVEPGLVPALRRLSPRQRTVAVLIDGYGLHPQETAELLGMSRSSVRRHHERALHKLRSALGVAIDV